MMKHIGKHDQRKTILLFKEVPQEEDMCLIVYTDKLPALIENPLMKCVESDVGQNANDITGPLSRTLMDDGSNLLQTLHSSGHIRKVPTNQMILTPNAQTTIRLDELNKIMKEMATGKEATTKLAEMDAQQGMHDPAKTVAAPVMESTVTDAPEHIPLEIMEEIIPAPVDMQDGVLTDAGIATSQLNQANAMTADAKRLLTEADILRTEAYTLAPELKPKKVVKKKAATEKATTAKRGPGRPRKNVASAPKG